MERPRKLRSFFALLIFWLAGTSNAYAAIAPATPAELPQAIQDCTTCNFPFGMLGPEFNNILVPLSGDTTDSSFWAFRYDNSAAASLENQSRILMQYELFAPSGSSGRHYHYDNGTPTGFNDSAAPYSTYVWLDIPLQLDFSENFHGITLYTELADPNDGISWVGRTNVVVDPLLGGPQMPSYTSQFYMNTADILSGSAFSQHEVFQGGYAPGGTFGDLLYSPKSAIPENVHDIALNLIYTNYSPTDGSLSFDLTDNRSVLLSNHMIDTYSPGDSGFIIDELYVQASVPLPATAWMMLSGVGALLGLGRRVRLSAATKTGDIMRGKT